MTLGEGAFGVVSVSWNKKGARVLNRQPSFVSFSFNEDFFVVFVFIEKVSHAKVQNHGEKTGDIAGFNQLRTKKSPDLWVFEERRFRIMTSCFSSWGSMDTPRTGLLLLLLLSLLLSALFVSLLAFLFACLFVCLFVRSFVRSSVGCSFIRSYHFPKRAVLVSDLSRSVREEPVEKSSRLLGMIRDFWGPSKDDICGWIYPPLRMPVENQGLARDSLL